MNCQPVSQASQEELQRLIQKAQERGEACFATLLSGVHLYVSLGREMELLETMRDFARDIQPAVDGTPTAAELERLYRQDTPPGETAS